MRDQHRPKQELIDDVVALRKQVADLKQAVAERRRVEDALRETLETHRALLDGLALPVCRLSPRGELALANRALATALGYASTSEMRNLVGVGGLFARPEEEARVLGRLAGAPSNEAFSAAFRRRDGSAVELSLQSGEDFTFVVAPSSLVPTT